MENILVITGVIVLLAIVLRINIPVKKKLLWKAVLSVAAIGVIAYELGIPLLPAGFLTAEKLPSIEAVITDLTKQEPEQTRVVFEEKPKESSPVEKIMDEFNIPQEKKADFERSIDNLFNERRTEYPPIYRPEDVIEDKKEPYKNSEGKFCKKVEVCN